jgi:uncharacterized protein YecE (DUF72 family)
VHTCVIFQLTVSAAAAAARSETWIVMDLMDRGNLAAAVRHSSMFNDDDGSLNAVSCVSSCMSHRHGQYAVHVKRHSMSIYTMLWFSAAL